MLELFYFLNILILSLFFLIFFENLNILNYIIIIELI